MNPNFSTQFGQKKTQNDPFWVRCLLTGSAIVLLTILVIVPLISVYKEALNDGVIAYFETLFDNADAGSAIRLTLLVAPCSVLLNTIFGVIAAWLLSRFRFTGRGILSVLIDIPFAVSPVVAGLMFVLLFGATGFFGPWLRQQGWQILFEFPALVIATTFTTLPFVVRELIPVLEAIGPEEEFAAVSLGASPWQIFRQITLPNIKWGLLYGIILCNARAMGEFGAVYVVSGHIAQETNTMPLQIEQFFQGFQSRSAFALASVLTFLAIVSLILKVMVEKQVRSTMKSVSQGHTGSHSQSE